MTKTEKFTAFLLNNDVNRSTQIMLSGSFVLEIKLAKKDWTSTILLLLMWSKTFAQLPLQTKSDTVLRKD